MVGEAGEASEGQSMRAVAEVRAEKSVPELYWAPGRSWVRLPRGGAMRGTRQIGGGEEGEEATYVASSAEEEAGQEGGEGMGMEDLGAVAGRVELGQAGGQLEVARKSSKAQRVRVCLCLHGKGGGERFTLIHNTHHETQNARARARARALSLSPCLSFSLSYIRTHTGGQDPSATET